MTSDVWFIYNRERLGEKNANFIAILKEKAEKLNLKIDILDVGRFIISTEDNGKLYYKGELVKTLPKIAFNRAPSAIELLRFLELKGVNTINNSESIVTVNNKFKTHCLFTKHNIKTPKTIYTPSKRISYNTLKGIFGPSFIAKDNTGSLGEGVFLIKNENDFKNLPKIKKYIYQEYIESSFGKDLRIIVLGDKILGGVMRSSSNKKEFRANLAQGGIAQKIEITKEIEIIAKKVQNIFNLEFFGLDLLIDKDGLTVCEINAVPGLKSFRYIKDVSISEEIYKYIQKEL